MVTKRLEINGEIIRSRVGRFLLIAVWVRHWRRRINTPIHTYIHTYIQCNQQRGFVETYKSEGHRFQIAKNGRTRPEGLEVKMNSYHVQSYAMRVHHSRFFKSEIVIQASRIFGISPKNVVVLLLGVMGQVGID